jgi:hypothetical protein
MGDADLWSCSRAFSYRRLQNLDLPGLVFTNQRLVEIITRAKSAHEDNCLAIEVSMGLKVEIQVPIRLVRDPNETYTCLWILAFLLLYLADLAINQPPDSVDRLLKHSVDMSPVGP